MDPFWETVKDFIVSFGWAKGTLTVFFWLAHWWIFRQYTGRLRDRQEQIDRLAAENRDYRDRFTYLLDKEYQYKPPQEIEKRRRQLEKRTKKKRR